MMDLPPPFDAAWFRFILGFIFGAVLGSFTTMLVYRLPRHLSIVLPRSSCTTCHHTLGACDLVPLLSWLTSGGKCRHCGAAIGARYFLIELGISIIFGIVGIFFPRFFT